jgi:putative FmdB family regulatory protein
VPTYQYACTACSHAFDTVQSFSDPTLTECPECHGRLRKIFSSVGVVFKGSGFYRNDSRSTAGSEGGSTSDSATSDKKTDAKPGTKTDAKSETAAKSPGSASKESAGAAPASSSAGSGSSSSSTTGTAA